MNSFQSLPASRLFPKLSAALALRSRFPTPALLAQASFAELREARGKTCSVSDAKLRGEAPPGRAQYWDQRSCSRECFGLRAETINCGIAPGFENTWSNWNRTLSRLLSTAEKARSSPRSLGS